MCQFISFVYRLTDDGLEVKVHDLGHHDATYRALGLSEAQNWYEGHYLPSGEIRCRTPGESCAAAETAIKAKWPTWGDFLGWALGEPGVKPLTTLYLGDTSVTDLAPLAGCKALTTLYLCDTGVTDLAPLAGCKALTTLDLCDTGVKNNAITVFRKEHPECTVYK